VLRHGQRPAWTQPSTFRDAAGVGKRGSTATGPAYRHQQFPILTSGQGREHRAEIAPDHIADAPPPIVTGSTVGKGHLPPAICLWRFVASECNKLDHQHARLPGANLGLWRRASYRCFAASPIAVANAAAPPNTNVNTGLSLSTIRAHRRDTGRIKSGFSRKEPKKSWISQT
jgi:hypothetical protein